MSGGEPAWLSVSAAARRCGLRESTVRGAVNGGELKAYRTPGAVGERRTSARIFAGDLDEWMRSQEPVTFAGTRR